MSMKLKIALFVLCCVIASNVSAKFLQEVELTDGTILVGYIYRQQPSKFMVFHADRAKKDPHLKYAQHDTNYTVQWKEIKYIRRASGSDDTWCYYKMTLKNGTTYLGQIEEQEPGVSLTIRLKDSGKKVTISSSDLRTSERVASSIDKDLWIDRQYTNRLRLTDDSFREGLIVLQYRGANTSDCYVELLHDTGYTERIFFPDIKEYITLIK